MVHEDYRASVYVCFDVVSEFAKHREASERFPVENGELELVRCPCLGDPFDDSFRFLHVKFEAVTSLIVATTGCEGVAGDAIFELVAYRAPAHIGSASLDEYTLGGVFAPKAETFIDHSCFDGFERYVIVGASDPRYIPPVAISVEVDVGMDSHG